MKKSIVLLFLCFGMAQAATDLPAVVATYDRSVSGTALPQTPIYVADRTALYRLTGVMTVVFPGTTGTICDNVFWTDGDTGAVINNGPCTSALIRGFGPNFVYTFYAQQGTPISVNTVLTSVTGALTYNLHFRLEQF